MREYESEPIRGLPEHLPPGEEMLWQGAPRWSVLARRAFHVWKVAIYFALIILWQIVSAIAAGETLAGILGAAVWSFILGVIAVGGLSLLAWAMARSTVYTITSRRVVMRFGVALPMIVNFPFAQVASAQMKRYRDDTGDIPLILIDSARASYMLMWPHARPWHLRRPQPMLRAIPDVSKVAEVLAGAINAYLAESGRATADESTQTEGAGAEQPAARI